MIGSQTSKLDEKNRLVIPSKMRAELGDHFYVTIGSVSGRGCLTIYSDVEWERFIEKYDSLPMVDQAGDLASILYNANECSVDKLGRISLSPFQMEYANITKEVVVSGRSRHAEIWALETFKDFQTNCSRPTNLLENMKML